MLHEMEKLRTKHKREGTKGTAGFDKRVKSWVSRLTSDPFTISSTTIYFCMILKNCRQKLHTMKSSS